MVVVVDSRLLIRSTYKWIRVRRRRPRRAIAIVPMGITRAGFRRIFALVRLARKPTSNYPWRINNSH